MFSWRKGSNWFGRIYQKLAHRPACKRAIVGLSIFLAIVLMISSGYYSKGYTLKAGEICPDNIRAPRNITVVDQVETDRLRQEAASKVDRVYRDDTQASQQASQNLHNVYAMVTDLQNLRLSPDERRLRFKNYLVQVLGVSQRDLERQLTDGALDTFLQLKGVDLKTYEDMSQNLMQDEMGSGLKSEALGRARQNLAEKIAWSQIPKDLQPVVSFILTNTIKPNLIFDQEGYDKRVAEVKEAVPPVQRSYQAGQIIVREGDPINAQNLAVLKQLGLLKGRMFWPTLLGIACLVLLTGIMILVYLYKFKRRLTENDQFLYLYGLLLVLTLLLAKGLTFIRLDNQPDIANLAGYLAPLAFGAMLITVLLDTGLAVFTSFMLSLLFGMIMDGQISFVITGLVGCLAGIYSISGITDRGRLMRGGLSVSLANAGVILILGLINQITAVVVIIGMAMGVLNGLLSSVLTVGCLPYLEAVFGLTSSVRLLELSNPNQVLLKRLLMEAPGTYHHSILVGNLAEAAAQAVQADPLLVRVGSYYHDIGKLKRPYFFIENQVAKDNPHDKIAPSLSTLIITSHVKDGLELAREHKLPKAVVDIIEQHHGTGLVAYFYQRALESDRPELVAESDFRYDSVKPQSKEAALVMLADCVEAAIRSLPKPTPGRLEGLTRRIIKEKLHDGQLDECDLTFKDLNRIAGAFVRVLGGIFHSRIEYPENLITEIERRKSRGAVVNQ